MQERTAGGTATVATARRGRSWSLAVAIPGSILATAQSAALQTYLAGQIARALAIFRVDEVIIFAERVRNSASSSEYDSLLGRLLQYLECPQYLRQHLFPRAPELQFAGLLNPLDTPHHPRKHEGILYREGVVVPSSQLSVASGRDAAAIRSRYVHVGWDTPIEVESSVPLTVGHRVTVRFENLRRSVDELTEGPPKRKRKRAIASQQKSSPGWKWSRAVAVSRDEPREHCGLYWGYRVRLAPNLVQALSMSNADVKIGTSEHGTDLCATLWPSTCPHLSMDRNTGGQDCSASSIVPPGGFHKLLVVFGGVHGLEASYGDKEVRKLFDAYVNACPDQGSRTIRTEEALYVVLSALQPWIRQNGSKGRERTT